MLQITKSLVAACTLMVFISFGFVTKANPNSPKAELISHVQVKKHPSSAHITLVRFALHYDARVSVFLQKSGSSALVQLKKTQELKKGVKTLQVDRVQYPASQYKLVIKAGKTSKVIDYSL